MLCGCCFCVLLLQADAGLHCPTGPRSAGHNVAPAQLTTDPPMPAQHQLSRQNRPMQLQDKDLQDRPMPAQPMPAQEAMQTGSRLLQRQRSAQRMHQSSSRTGSNREDRSSLTGKHRDGLQVWPQAQQLHFALRASCVSTSDRTSSLTWCANDTLLLLRPSWIPPAVQLHSHPTHVPMHHSTSCTLFGAILCCAGCAHGILSPLCPSWTLHASFPACFCSC